MQDSSRSRRYKDLWAFPDLSHACLNSQGPKASADILVIDT